MYSNNQKLRFSLIVSAIILVAVYLFDNIKFSLVSIPNSTTIIENYRLKRQAQDDTVHGSDTSYFFVNTGYDPTLIDLENDYGQVRITDREKILRFLQELEKYDNYKEVFIDIRFEEGYKTSCDSSLVEQILRMRNVFVAKHWKFDPNNPKNSSDYPLIDRRLLDYAAYADYGSTLLDNSFTRYQFLQTNGPSAALRIYQDVNSRTIKKYGTGFFSLYFDSWRLCFNSSLIRLKEDFSDAEYCAAKDKFTNLGEGILGYWKTFPEVEDRFYSGLKDKVIIIGDFVFDTHDTYFKRQPGPYLTYLAYSSLKDKEHIVNPMIAASVYILYVLLILMILHYEFSPTRLTRFITRIKVSIEATLAHLSNNKFLSWIFRFRHLLIFAFSLLGYSALLSIVSLLFYVIFDISISVLIPSLFFSIIDYGYKYSSYENQ